MKITVLDAYSINPGDLSWDSVAAFGDFTAYDRTDSSEIPARIKDCEAFFVSKCKITREIMEAAPKLRFIGVTATGYDNVDLKAAEDLGIAVCHVPAYSTEAVAQHVFALILELTNRVGSYNSAVQEGLKAAEDLGIAVCHVPAYSTEAVAQHVFALILELTNRVGSYNSAVQEGAWYKSPDFTFIRQPLTLLSGKSLGIIGYGNIGKRVAQIGKAFGMEIRIYSQDKESCVSSDFLTLHCPLTEENRGFINREFISSMKDGAVLINTARGGLVNEEDLADSLKSGKLSAAALDVISSEPPCEPHALIGLENCILTPHIAWMPRETRQKVIDICTANLKSFLDGGRLNRIV